MWVTEVAQEEAGAVSESSEETEDEEPAKKRSRYSIKKAQVSNIHATTERG